MFQLIYKPQNISSFKFIRNYARDNKIKKIGHTGTLDPLAEGLLLVATNQSTKLIQYVKQTTKTYIAIAKLGIKTDTYDIEGKVVAENKNFSISTSNVEDQLNSFLIEKTQIPPIFSAKKINGKRAYKLARLNQITTLKPIPIHVHEIALLEFKDNLVKFEIKVSKGTYIRTIINDLGNKLKCFATMSQLTRTAIGELTLSYLDSKIPNELLFDYPKINLKKSDAIAIQHGKTIENTNFKDDQIIFLLFNGKIFAIAKVQEKLLKPIKVIGKILI